MADTDIDNGKRKLGLKKEQILRGFDSYKRVLENSRVYSTDLLLVYLNKETLSDKESNSKKVESPLAPKGMIQKIKVGFIISKKKIRKAVMRNYGKRLMKEAYRMNQPSPEFLNRLSSNNINIIFAYTGNGIQKLKNKAINFEDLKDEMRILLAKILK